MSDDIERRVLAEIEKHLGDATNDAARDRIELRDAVCAYVVDQHSRGITLAVIVGAVEDILKRAEKRVGGVSDVTELTRLLIDWCIQANPLGPPRIA